MGHCLSVYSSKLLGASLRLGTTALSRATTRPTVQWNNTIEQKSPNCTITWLSPCESGTFFGILFCSCSLTNLTPMSIARSRPHRAVEYYSDIYLALSLRISNDLCWQTLTTPSQLHSFGFSIITTPPQPLFLDQNHSIALPKCRKTHRKLTTARHRYEYHQDSCVPALSTFRPCQWVYIDRSPLL